MPCDMHGMVTSAQVCSSLHVSERTCCVRGEWALRGGGPVPGISAAVMEASEHPASRLAARRAAHVFPGRCLARRPWVTVDLNPEVPDSAAGGAAVALSAAAGGGASGSTPRASAVALLQRAFDAAGATSAGEQVWASEVEASAWSAAAASSSKRARSDAAAPPTTASGHAPSALALPGAEASNGGTADLSAAGLRHYRAEVRRVCAALKERSPARSLLSRLRAGELRAAGILALPAEELMPEAKRARLRELRASAPEEVGATYDIADSTMACVECGKTGAVRYNRLACAREGFTKAETWGSKETEGKGDRCQAQCADCLAEWVFEQ